MFAAASNSKLETPIERINYIIGWLEKEPKKIKMLLGLAHIAPDENLSIVYLNDAEFRHSQLLLRIENLAEVVPAYRLRDDGVAPLAVVKEPEVYADRPSFSQIGELADGQLKEVLHIYEETACEITVRAEIAMDSEDDDLSNSMIQRIQEVTQRFDSLFMAAARQTLAARRR